MPLPFEHGSTFVPLGELAQSVSELVYHQDGGLVRVRGETFGRGSAKGDV